MYLLIILTEADLYPCKSCLRTQMTKTRAR